MRPNWIYDENKSAISAYAPSPRKAARPQGQGSLTGSGGSNKFMAILDFNGFEICTGEADNKKGAKEKSARYAICLVAHSIYKARFSPEEPHVDSRLL